jgi:hypothetical protein
MSLRDQLRKAEKEISLAAQQGIDHARKEWADAERRIRRKMRIYPDHSIYSNAAEKEEPPVETASQRPPVGGRAAEHLCDPEASIARKAIVSIRGRDLEEVNDAEDDECGHLIQSR